MSVVAEHGADGRPGSSIGRPLLLLALLAFLLRLGVAEVAGPFEAVSDGRHFSWMAERLLEGHGFAGIPNFRTSHRAPLQAAWLAGLYRVLGVGPFAGVVGGALLGAALTIATGLLGHALLGPRAAVLAAAVAAVAPRFVDYGTRLWSLSEGLFATLFTFALVAWCRAEAGSRTAAVVAGFLLAVSALTRPVVLLFPVLLGLRVRRGRTAVVVLALAAFALTLAPWTWRNYRVYHRFIPVSTMGGIVLYQGFHVPRDGWGNTPWEEIHALTHGASSEPEVSDILVRKTLRDIAAEPAAALALLPRKLLWLLSPFSERSGRMDAVVLLVLVLGALGAADLRRKPVAVIPLLSLVYVIGMSLVFYGSPRFRMPAEPTLVAFAATAVCVRARTQRGRRALALVLLVVALLGLAPGLDRASIRHRFDGLLDASAVGEDPAGTDPRDREAGTTP